MGYSRSGIIIFLSNFTNMKLTTKLRLEIDSLRQYTQEKIHILYVWSTIEDCMANQSGDLSKIAMFVLVSKSMITN
jgi:hypothetical protein